MLYVMCNVLCVVYLPHIAFGLLEVYCLAVPAWALVSTGIWSPQTVQYSDCIAYKSHTCVSEAAQWGCVKVAAVWAAQTGLVLMQYDFSAVGTPVNLDGTVNPCWTLTCNLTPGQRSRRSHSSITLTANVVTISCHSIPVLKSPCISTKLKGVYA